MGKEERCDFTDDQKKIRFMIQNGKCDCCEEKFVADKLPFDAHHVNGDSSDCSDSNLSLLCEECHIHCVHNGDTKKPPLKNPICRKKIKKALR